MELIGISEFIKDMEILRDLQRKMISILSCDESPISRSNQINELFIFFEEISISNNFSLYEAFLCILVHLSIYFDFHLTDEEIVFQRQEIFQIILKELILKQSLKTSFSQFTLFRIFKENKHLLLFLFEEEIFDLTFLKRYMSYVSDKDLFLFFILEIHKSNSQLYEKLKKSFNLTEIKINQFF
ncbi:hypothetical protein TRFO_08436 [Tritrichomonas foetus]|uniref:Uncharacterized protein n=1 Tax=Tritrichomonas foetus TaxID=1144522 RepID=A0A1J4JPP4_9EUKA|nr:hypothetical protein TRFO_08436 [Tritrichomonas foetus]|eukprot:OHS99483.1 hypothetical protein TRFO_08436 [Tritrichomonas foetus]